MLDLAESQYANHVLHCRTCTLQEGMHCLVAIRAALPHFACKPFILIFFIYYPSNFSCLYNLIKGRFGGLTSSSTAP